MKIRDLNAKSNSLKNKKEFNHLRLSNFEEFLINYKNNIDIYSPPFKILAELEEKILFVNDPESTVLCSYKEDGDVVFDLEEIKEEGNLRIIVYRFSTFVS